MRFNNYHEVVRADEETQIDLLRSGDGPERVWAAWAIGLRQDRNTVSLISEDEEPDAGVRLHLVVILAGYGERVALFAIAEADPDPHVRAAALVYLIRTAGESQKLDTLTFISKRFKSESNYSPIVRTLKELPLEWPDLNDHTLQSLLSNPHREVRLNLIDFLKARPHVKRKVLSLIRRRVELEEDHEIHTALVDSLGYMNRDTWGIFHDGSIEKIEGNVPGEVILHLEIEYLRKMYPGTGTGFHVHLDKCTLLEFEEYNSATFTRDIKEIEARHLRVDGLQSVSPLELACCEGVLRLDYRYAEVRMDSGELVTDSQLIDACNDYWG